jgi:SAM-dependent methyltransferase
VLPSLLTRLFISRWKRPYLAAVAGKRGLELGGPSPMFRGDELLPVYVGVGALDCCNFATETLWRANIVDGAPYHYSPRKPAGTQYIREATALTGIADGSYDFVLASHVIEHVANPLLAMAEISRILRDQGSLILVLPHKEGTFDHKRPVTPLSHLLDDLKQGTTEDDTTHLDEWLRLVDLERAPEAKPFEAFRQRSLKNFENRGMHHHVFDMALAIAMVDSAGLQVHAVNTATPFHIIVLASKAQKPDNSTYLARNAACYAASTFASDRP